MDCTIEEAEKYVSELLAIASRGGKVTVTKNGLPIVVIGSKKPFPFGILSDAGPVPDGFFDAELGEDDARS